MFKAQDEAKDAQVTLGKLEAVAQKLRESQEGAAKELVQVWKGGGVRCTGRAVVEVCLLVHVSAAKCRNAACGLTASSTWR
jgi:hypothetical protein